MKKLKRLIRDLLYFIAEGAKGLRSNTLVSVTAMGVMAACLLVTGCFGLIAANLQLNVEQLMGDREFIAYLSDDLSESEQSLTGLRLEQLDGVMEVQFITNKEALEDRLSEDSLTSMYFQNIDYNLLQNRYRITVTGEDVLESVVNAASAVEGVDHVYASYTLARQISNMRDQCLTGLAVMIVIFIAASVFIISNTVRLAVLAREDEISIMRLVGATKRFIRAPFIVEGMLIGLVGGLLAFLFTSGLYVLAFRALADTSSVFSLFTYRRIVLPLVSADLFAGLITGVCGTVVSMRHALRT